MRYGVRCMGLTGLRSKYLLLCEGMHDAQFFLHLGLARGFSSLFQVSSCGSVAGASGPHHGISYLTPALNALPGVPGFDTTLEAILIAADNDGDAVASFSNVQTLIGGAAEISPGKKYAVPPAPLRKGGSGPAIVVMMIPWTGVLGALDTLCHDSASSKRPAIAAAVDVFASSVGVNDANGWSITKQHKMKLRSLIAAAHMRDPYLSPTYVWSDGTDLVPLDNNAFDDIADFLRDFPTFMATP